MSLEIHKTLVLSTAHMTLEDSEIIPFAHNVGLVVYELEEYGWLIYVNPEMLDIARLNDFSDAFKQAIKLAQDNECAYLRFDRDANVVDELPSFDW